MKHLIKLGIILATSILGLWSGSTAARHVDPVDLHTKMVEIEIPAFTVTVSTSKKTVVHAVAKMTATVPEKFAQSTTFTDHLSAAALEGTMAGLSTIDDGKTDNAEMARTIISTIKEAMPDSGVQNLTINNLTAGRFASRG